MGTRCITEVRSKWDDFKKYETHAVIYRHWDGYLEGHGRWLFEFLNGIKIINGIPCNPPEKFANGPGRLAAQIVSQLQIDGHDPDLMPGMGNYGQEYHYRIDIDYSMSGGKMMVYVYDGPMTAFGAGGEECTNLIFSGAVEEFGNFLDSKS